MAAQEVTASLTGRVSDSTGAVIPQVTVTAINVDTNTTHSAVTSSTGDYLIPLLRPGNYKLIIAQPGFRTYEQYGIRLEVNQRARIDVVLQIGQASETINVTANVAAITTESSSVGKVIDNKTITMMPLNGRLNIVGLMALAPGIQNAGSQDGVPAFGITPTVSGASSTQAVAFTLDGVSNSLSWIERGFGEWPPLDGIQEFKVITSVANAEFGKPNQIIVVSKGGTNQWHGTLLVFNRNRITAAKNFFATHLPKPKYNRNEFGGNFSGPVRLPHLYNGQDRTFFFVNYEGFRRRQAETRTASVPTTAMRAGDFSGLPPVIDPLSGLPFPDNQIPASRLNSVTQRIQQLYPMPNRLGTGPAGTGNNLTDNLPLAENVDRYSFRIDHTLSEKDQIYGSLLVGNLGPNALNGPVRTFGGMKGIGEHNRNTSLSWNHTFTPALFNELRLGYLHVRIFRITQNTKLDPGTFIPGLGTQDIGGVPSVNITNIVGMGEAGSGDLHQNIQLNDNLSWVRGSHVFKMGFQYQHPDHYNIAARPPQRGLFNFNGRYTGNAYADFLLGYPSLTQRPSPSVFVNKFRQNRYYFYWQDDWKVTQNLTLNYGVRYELQLFQPQRYGHATMFLPGKGLILFGERFPRGTQQRQVDAFNIKLSKDVGLPANLFDYLGQDTNNWAPRFGFAYRLRYATVLRGGFGVYYNAIGLNHVEGIANQAPFGLVETFEQLASPVPAITMSHPFPGQGSIPSNPVALAIEKPEFPYALQWNLTVEREVSGDVGLRVSYLGQRNVKGLGNYDLNAVAPAPGPIQPRRPIQPFSNINIGGAPIFQNTTHQLQGGIQKRYARGLLLNAEYQFVRSIGIETYQNPFNTSDSRGNIGGVRKHVLQFSYVYDLPFGRGKRWLGDTQGRLGAVINGWQLTGITAAMSGLPFSPSFTTSVQGSVGGRPDVVVGVPLYPARRTIDQYFNPSAFRKPVDFTYGNAGYNILWGPGQQTWDVSLAKGSQIGERANLQFRFDVFSLFNHPTFGVPAADITNTATVGRISGAGGNRTMQFGAKLTF